MEIDNLIDDKLIQSVLDTVYDNYEFFNEYSEEIPNDSTTLQLIKKSFPDSNIKEQKCYALGLLIMHKLIMLNT